MMKRSLPFVWVFVSFCVSLCMCVCVYAHNGVCSERWSLAVRDCRATDPTV